MKRVKFGTKNEGQVHHEHHGQSRGQRLSNANVWLQLSPSATKNHTKYIFSAWASSLEALSPDIHYARECLKSKEKIADLCRKVWQTLRLWQPTLPRRQLQPLRIPRPEEMVSRGSARQKLEGSLTEDPQRAANTYRVGINFECYRQSHVVAGCSHACLNIVGDLVQ